MEIFKLIKNELNNRYGDYEVIEYTSERVPSNGCVVWKCRCVHCGTIHYINGNHLRFGRIKWCKCHGRKRR